jgi:3-hydroxyacyl-CoA dehydrogenase
MSTFPYRIRKVAVLGSGVMGSQIAAHCVNAGMEVLLLDLKSDDPDNPNKTAIENIKKLRDMKPSPLALPEYSHRITPGNFEDDLEQLSDVDWICEVVVERMDIKQDLMAKIEKVRSEGTIISSNTSGLPIEEIGEGRSDEFQAHLLGTHFFNPPRYMKLLEIIPTGKTDDEVVDYMTQFAERMLGKGVVRCKDTPNFIANRIGVYSMATILPYYFDKKFRAEEIDELTGILTGYSKAATFRTADMVGLDVLKHVADNLYPNVPDDESREAFKLPEKLGKMVEEGMLGNKSGQGFYKKVKTDKGKEYKVLDPESFEYESQQEVAFDSVAKAKKEFKSSRDRLKFLVNQDDEVGQFLWEIHCDLLLYAAHRIPEIADSVEAIDRAMQWGFNWELGPFQRWDAIGVRESVERMQEEGRDVPEHVLAMLESGRESFYDRDEGTVYNLASESAEPLSPPAQGAITIKGLKSDNKELFGNKSAAVYDMGDGIALFEMRSKMNTLGNEVVQTLLKAFEEVPKRFDGMVIGNDGDNFSVGANLMEAMGALQQGQRSQVEQAVKNFQDVAVGLRYLPIPVVAAPFNRTLGGGTEFMMRADRVIAHHELYAGLVEVGVGLIPAGGGTTELLCRFMNRVSEDDNADPLPHLKDVFKIIGMAKVSDSAAKAKQIGYLKESDPIIMNRDLLLAAAKQEARAMADRGYQPPAKPTIPVQGKTGFSALKLMMYIMKESKWITEYDAVVGEKVAYVLSGGNVSDPQEIPEDALLALEREAFMDLLDDQRTLDRIEHMLKKGKPLRN